MAKTLRDNYDRSVINGCELSKMMIFQISKSTFVESASRQCGSAAVSIVVFEPSLSVVQDAPLALFVTVKQNTGHCCCFVTSDRFIMLRTVGSKVREE